MRGGGTISIRRDIAVFLRRPAVGRFHRVAGMGLIQRIQQQLPRHLAGTALVRRRRYRVKRRPVFVILKFGTGILRGFVRQQRAFVDIARFHHALHMAPHARLRHVRPGDDGKNHVLRRFRAVEQHHAHRG